MVILMWLNPLEIGELSYQVFSFRTVWHPRNFPFFFLSNFFVSHMRFHFSFLFAATSFGKLRSNIHGNWLLIKFSIFKFRYSYFFLFGCLEISYFIIFLHFFPVPACAFTCSLLVYYLLQRVYGNYVLIYINCWLRRFF